MSQPNFQLLEENIFSEKHEISAAAEKTLLSLAEAGSINAAEILNDVYSNGSSNIPANSTKALGICAGSGDAFGHYLFAKELYRRGDYAKALENIRVAAEAGGVEAKTMFATMLISGLGCAPSIQEGLSMFEMVADRSTDAQSILADFYFHGQYVEKNISKASEYIQMIPQWKLVYLARCSPEKAADLYLLKAKIGYRMNEAGVAEEWRHFLKKAADLGNEEAKKLLAAAPETTKANSFKNTVKSSFCSKQLSESETEISYKYVRPLALGLMAVGALISITFVGMFIGLPMVFLGIVLLLLKKTGRLILVQGQGVKFDRTFGETRVPFSEITRVGWKKTHVFFPTFFDLTIDTKGTTITVARGLTQAVAQDLQQLLLEA